jgi:hypothetical protein
MVAPRKVSILLANIDTLALVGPNACNDELERWHELMLIVPTHISDTPAQCAAVPKQNALELVHIRFYHLGIDLPSSPSCRSIRRPPFLDTPSAPAPTGG